MVAVNDVAVEVPKEIEPFPLAIKGSVVCLALLQHS